MVGVPVFDPEVVRALSGVIRHRPVSFGARPRYLGLRLPPARGSLVEESSELARSADRQLAGVGLADKRTAGGLRPHPSLPQRRRVRLVPCQHGVWQETLPYWTDQPASEDATTTCRLGEDR